MTFQIDSVEVARFIPVTEIVPKEWECWFYQAISEDAPFSWGDNNRTLVTLERFIDHCENSLSYLDDDELDPNERDYFINELKLLATSPACHEPAGLYVDLEN
jgi:hypothetical protein